MIGISHLSVIAIGLAPIASAIGVEMMVALLQHPLGASAPSIGADGNSQGAFGGIPHMVGHCR